MPTKPRTITQLRERIFHLENQRASIQGAWKPRAETARVVAASVDAAAARFDAQLVGSLALAARPEGRGFSLFQIEPTTRDVADALCFLLGDQLKDRLTARLSTMPWRGEDEDTQPARLAAIDDELRAARQTLADLRRELEEQL